MTLPSLAAPDRDTLLHCLLEALRAEGRAGELHDECVLLPSGLAIDVDFGEARPLAGGNVAINSRTLVWHDAFPAGFLEYQHASGPDVEAATTAGLRQWVQLDLATIEDALPGAGQRWLRLELTLPAGASGPARRRRIVLGPIARRGGAAATDDPEHPFCPCCLFTQGLAAFQPLLEQAGAIGIRLYAARNADGSVDADCRANGADFAAGAEALRAYAATWPGSGIEFRKQYAVVYTPGEDEPDPADDAACEP